ncbi:hypothetical protein, partial [Ralstonia pseudosolanacearum]|uniref:hypothetical protein n=1 Tax=Ralstonia pseudosolanacearum TaxID=1310165 RepID=UPI002006BAE8
MQNKQDAVERRPIIHARTTAFGRRLHNRQQRLQCLPQFIADLLSCHANNNAQPPAFDDLVLLAALSAGGRWGNCWFRDLARETLINGVREWNREPSCSRFPHRGKEVPIEHVFRRFRVV